jgi:hypothetical protein
MRPPSGRPGSHRPGSHCLPALSIMCMRIHHCDVHVQSAPVATHLCILMFALVCSAQLYISVPLPGGRGLGGQGGLLRCGRPA